MLKICWKDIEVANASVLEKVDEKDACQILSENKNIVGACA